MNDSFQSHGVISRLSSLFRTYNHLFKNRLTWYAAGGIVLALILIIVFATGGKTEDDGTWVPVIKDTFYVDIIESGEIRAVNSYNVQSPMEWRMELQISDMVKEGTHVKEGDLLVQFITSALEEELETAIDQLKAQEAELLSVKTKQKSQISQFESDLKMAEYSREASKLQLELLKYESEVRKEDARLSYQKALISFDETGTKIRTQKIMDEAEMGRVMQTLRYRQNYVKDLNRRIEQLTLRAPISGMVVYNEIGGWRGTPKHKVAIGETVWPRMTVIKIPDLSEMECIIHINEIDALKIITGQEVTLRLDAFDDRLFNGRVFSVAPLADKSQSEEETHIKDYEIIIRIDESDQILKPGMSAQTRIILEEIPDAAYIPIGAVFEVEGETVVFPEKKYPDPVPVKPGKRNDRFIMIEGDIADVDKVALYPPSPDAHTLGWFAEMENRATRKETLLGHLATIEESNIVGKIAEKAKNKPKEIPPQFQMLADMLEKAKHPLTEEQIEKLANLKPDSDAKDKMFEFLTEEQKTVLENSRIGTGGTSGEVMRGGRMRMRSGGPR